MILELIEREYDLCLEDSTMTIFAPQIIQSTCHLKQVDNKPNEGGEYYITLDTAYSSEDYFVAMVFEYKNNHYYQTEMYREKGVNSTVHVYTMSKLIKKYNPVKVGIETTGIIGQISFEILQKGNPDISFVSIRTTLSSKSMMIEKLNHLLNLNNISLFDNSEIKKEFLFFQSGSENNSDDIVMATAFLSELI